MRESDYFDQRGRAAVYLDSDDNVRDWRGSVIGYHDGDGGLFNRSGDHVGTISNGWIRDLDGECIAFTSGASNGPVPPVPSVPPVKSVPSVAPVRPVFRVKRIGSVPRLAWSRLTPLELFA